MSHEFDQPSNTYNDFNPSTIPDWAIADIVRGMLQASEPTSSRARVILDAAKRRAEELRS